MFGLFGSSAPKCDWCGIEIEGTGVADGELRLCSQSCLDQKNAPPAESEPTSTARPEMDIDRAREELGIAIAELEQYTRLARELDQQTNCESEFMDAQHSYFQVWERLDAIRNYVAVRGGPVADYDKRRAVSLATADRYDIITLKNYKGQDTRNVGTATFEPGNQDLAINAIRAISAALDALG